MENNQDELMNSINAKLDKILEILSQSKSIRNGSDLLSIEDVEKEYGISNYKQRQARKDPRDTLEFIMVGSGIKYRRSQVEAYLDKMVIS